MATAAIGAQAAAAAVGQAWRRAHARARAGCRTCTTAAVRAERADRSNGQAGGTRTKLATPDGKVANAAAARMRARRAAEAPCPKTNTPCVVRLARVVVRSGVRRHTAERSAAYPCVAAHRAAVEGIFACGAVRKTNVEAHETGHTSAQPPIRRDLFGFATTAAAGTSRCARRARRHARPVRHAVSRRADGRTALGIDDARSTVVQTDPLARRRTGTARIAFDAALGSVPAFRTILAGVIARRTVFARVATALAGVVTAGACCIRSVRPRHEQIHVVTAAPGHESQQDRMPSPHGHQKIPARRRTPTFTTNGMSVSTSSPSTRYRG